MFEHRGRRAALIVWAALAATSACSAPPDRAPRPETPDATAQPLVETECRSCHGGGTCTAGMACAHHALVETRGYACGGCHGTVVLADGMLGMAMVRDCTVCHGSASHEAAHASAVAPAQDCTACHAASFFALHSARGVPCTACHDGVDLDVQAAIADGKAGLAVYCARCHASFGDHAAQHDLAPAGADGTGYLAVHAASALPVRCFACHDSVDPVVQDAIARGMAGAALGCADCHVSAGGGVVAGAPPIARVAASGAAEIGQALALDGSASSDADGSVASHAWTFGDGATATGPSVTHAYASAGTYAVTLTVTDDAGLTGTATVTVTVTTPTAPAAPVAVAGSAIAVVADRETTFTAEGSTAAPGHWLVDYRWSFGDGTTSTGYVTTKAYRSTGTFTARLTVRDDTGATGTATKLVTVVSELPNQPPVAIAPPPQGAEVDHAVTFDGTASTDPDGRIESWYWRFGDDHSGSGARVSHVYERAGTYSATLTVTDDRGARASATSTVTVSAPNLAPVAVAGESRTLSAGQSVTLTAQGSYDRDGAIVDYAWTFGDGYAGHGYGVSHLYRATGTYTVTLTVTDDLGATATATTYVRVTEP
jgi:PKD repeat protein